jgi:RNA polymerase sigma factor (sigma-70 family)
VTAGSDLENLLRHSAPRVLAAILRRHGNLATAEDAVQEALLAAAAQWPGQGTPRDPEGWLVTVATRRLIDQRRTELAGRRREETAAAQTRPEQLVAAAADDDPAARDDTLTLLVLCCHPSLTPPSQIALTLRAVGGLATAEIARAFLVPETTMAQRISRAKQQIRAAGARFCLPPPGAERAGRLRAVLHVLYLTFNEGYTATSGPQLQRTDLTREAIRLTRTLHELLPGDGEITGLLALMLLTDARRPARTLADGSLVPLPEQDRGLWDREAIKEGITLISEALARARLGPYQVQAAIAAVHAEAARAQDTDWRQIEALYQLAEQLDPNPIVTLNHAVAAGMAHGPQAGLALLAPLETDSRMSGHHRLHAVRAHLLEMAGDHEAARASYESAARLTTSVPEQNYLQGRATRLGTSRATAPATPGHSEQQSCDLDRDPRCTDGTGRRC